MTKTIDADVVVVGAGVTGTYAAELLARQGLKTILLDRHLKGKTGAQWVNGVSMNMLQAADLPAPPDDCIYSHGERFIFKMAHGDHRFVLEDTKDVFDVDMRRYGDWFLERARKAGVTVLLGADVKGVELSGNDRISALKVIRKVRGQDVEQRFEARLFVDASGLPAVLRKGVPALQEQCPKFAPNELCSAAAYIYTIDDAKGAIHYLKQHKLKPGDVLATLGQHGNYSLLRIHVSRDLKEIAFLTGALAVRQYPSAQKIIHTFKKEHAWVGSPLFGGSRLIPLRPPFARLVHEGLALIGDSGCQTYTPHASGIGIGLVAAKELASALRPAIAKRQDVGSLSALMRYEKSFHKNWLTLLTAAESLRRLSLQLAPATLQKIYESGLVKAEMVRDILLQRPIKLDLAHLPSQLASLFRNPSLIPSLAPLLGHAVLARVGPEILWRLGRRVFTEERLMWFADPQAPKLKKGKVPAVGAKAI